MALIESARNPILSSHAEIKITAERLNDLIHEPPKNSTARAGGANGRGTVFKITPQGTLTTLYNFCPQTGCVDGQSPQAGLVQGTDGNLYGTTSYGGADGHGTVFKITLQGTLTTLHSFCSVANCTDGDTPYAGVIQGTDRNFYGTTLYGETGLLMCPPEKSRHVDALDPEQSVLSSPCCRAHMAKNGHLSLISGEIAAGSLCS